MGRKKQVKTIDWLIKNYIDFFKEFGMNEDNIRRYHNEWKEEFTESIEDFLWHIFNHLLHQNSFQSQDFIGLMNRNRDIYSQMLFFRRNIEGKKGNRILKILNQTKLSIQNEDSGLYWDVVVIGDDECEAYQKIKDKKFPIKDVIKKDVIPYDNCKRERGCVCEYGYLARRDSQGKLIFRD